MGLVGVARAKSGPCTSPEHQRGDEARDRYEYPHLAGEHVVLSECLLDGAPSEHPTTNSKPTVSTTRSGPTNTGIQPRVIDGSVGNVAGGDDQYNEYEKHRIEDVAGIFAGSEE